MSPDKLVYMANQIATFFKSQPDADKAARIAAHIHDFWEPRMREQFFAMMDAGQPGIDPLVAEAMGRLRQAA